MRAHHAVSRAVLAAVCLAAPCVARAAVLSGVVADSDKLALPSVTVIAVDAAGHDRLLVTDEGGRFCFSDLPAGTYSIAAELPGFGTVMKTGVHVSDEHAVSLPLSLAQIPLSYSLVVKGTARATDADSAPRKMRRLLARAK